MKAAGVHVNFAPVLDVNDNPKKKYNVATLDYLANGGDYMTSLVGTKRLFADNVKVSVRYLDYIAKLTKEGKVIDGEDELRMKLVE